MGLELVLNDLSLLPPAEDVYMARQRMGKFIETFVTAVSLKIEKALRTADDMNMIELASGYSVAQWRNDLTVDKDARTYLRTIATKKPYLQGISDSKILDTYYASEFLHSEKQAAGLGMAFLLDALSISFHSHPAWETSQIQLSLVHLQEDSTVEAGSVSVKHACFKEHIFEHRAWIKKRTTVSIESGMDLDAHREALYPHLQFCSSAIKQIRDLPHGEIHLQQIKRHLLDLNDYCETWTTGSFSASKIPGKITEESKVTLDKYAEAHIFLTPDGRMLKFSWHSRVTPGKWRIYFYPLEKERLIIIGHIGTKFQNMNYPT